ncbi:ketopantoate reductase family protein [Clostridium cellulovorans]|uniref:2-dehydropantoate 2-reductase n=1 Tax=Clostridium cellulovorans (strain ATCC 35296 / DSM 3052 / OCM 3 / 743B) TaxID=573061 RepID=D9SLS4_CLOC7|nr:2-dehydropantoate 2-reductase [Clostridium cellulovorans]ADL53711.1 2-dehydropantoate 2-reductase [Clostridium cellulovorans 743B]
MKNVAFIGVGGVGGYFGGKMAQLLVDAERNLKIYFVARGNHLEVIQKNGLTLITKQEGTMKCVPTMATDRLEELPILDICYICVKQYDLDDTLIRLVPKMGDNTKIIPLLNGIDIYERIRKIIKNGVVFPACVYVGTHIKEPGIVEQNGGACTIIFGKDPKNTVVDATDVCELMDRANIQYSYSSEYTKEIWSKYIFIAAYGLVTASENKTLGQVFKDEDSSKKVKGIMKEIVEISKKEEVNLPENIIESAYNKARNFPYEAKTSFQRDFELKDKKDERELFGQTLIELAAKYDLPIPFICTAYEKINSIG